MVFGLVCSKVKCNNDTFLEQGSLWGKAACDGPHTLATQVMAANDLSRESMDEPAQFIRLQKLIARAQYEAEEGAIRSAGSNGFIKSDRSVVDPLAYTAWRFGISSPEVRGILSSYMHKFSPFSICLQFHP